MWYNTNKLNLSSIKILDEDEKQQLIYNKNKEKYENAYIAKRNASEIKHKPAFAQCISSVLAGKKTGETAIFAMLFSHMSADKFFEASDRDGESALCEAINAMYKVFVKSK